MQNIKHLEYTGWLLDIDNTYSTIVQKESLFNFKALFDGTMKKDNKKTPSLGHMNIVYLPKAEKITLDLKLCLKISVL